MNHALRTFAAALLLTTFAAHAQAKLKPGDAAPPLKVGKWVKGEPVKAMEKGKVYVVECWATWCGPCRASIPHVTELQKKYADKGLVVIGMNVWENDESEVEPFVKQMGDKMDYRVVLDDKSHDKKGAMATTWMTAAEQNGIPCSFIVDRDTKVAWIGHPMTMEKVLGQVIEGKFDLKAEAARQAKEEETEKAFGEAMQAKDYDKALGVLDELVKADPEKAQMVTPTRIQILMMKKDYKGANAAAKQLNDAPGEKQPQMLLSVAYGMLQSDSKEVDADLALKMAEAASKAGGELEAPAKMVMAKAHAAKGDYAKAAEFQQQAVDGSEGRQKQAFQRDLDTYKAKAESKDKSDAKKDEKK